MVEADRSYAKLEREVRRGVLVLAVLSRLSTPHCGYALRQALAEGGMRIEEGALYPLLRRLESQGLLAGEWNAETAPPRRYYRLSEEGRRAFATSAAQLCVTWHAAFSAPQGMPGDAAW